MSNKMLIFCMYNFAVRSLNVFASFKLTKRSGCGFVCSMFLNIILICLFPFPQTTGQAKQTTGQAKQTTGQAKQTTGQAKQTEQNIHYGLNLLLHICWKREPTN
jgi:hypothetical protein